jgi:6-phosphogluconolactonase
MTNVDNACYNCQMIRSYRDAEGLFTAAAQLIVELSDEAIADHGTFFIALAGGSTPQRLYELLAEPEWSGQIDWSAWQVFFSDERSVPYDDPASNFGMARKSLLAKLPLELSQLHPVATDRLPSDAAVSMSLLLDG